MDCCCRRRRTPPPPQAASVAATASGQQGSRQGVHSDCLLEGQARDRWNTKCRRAARAGSAPRGKRGLTFVSRRIPPQFRTFGSGGSFPRDFSGGAGAALRFQHALRGRRILRELLGRAPRTRDQLAAAVRTLALQYSCHTRSAERALERADERLASNPAADPCRNIRNSDVAAASLFSCGRLSRLQPRTAARRARLSAGHTFLLL